MKSTQLITITTSIFLLSLNFGFSQGSLTPPGPPAPTMKTLDQVQPRVPISYEEFFIGSPGSYYLTTNLVESTPYGIWIASDNVTVDLSGYTIFGSSGSRSGIHINGAHTNIVIQNGSITGWGTNGIDWLPFPPQGLVVRHLNLTGNGQCGVVTGNGGSVSDCVVSFNGAVGILVNGNGGRIIDNILITNNTSFISTVHGIQVEGSYNRVEGNHIVCGSGGYGIQYYPSGYTNNIIIKNTVEGNGINNYSTNGASGNDCGPIGTAATATSPWANISD